METKAQIKAKAKYALDIQKLKALEKKHLKELKQLESLIDIHIQNTIKGDA